MHGALNLIAKSTLWPSKRKNNSFAVLPSRFLVSWIDWYPRVFVFSWVKYP